MSLLGEQIIKFDKKVFTDLYVADEDSAGFEIKPPRLSENVMFHNMVNLKLSKYSYTNIHGYMTSFTSPVNFYSN